jgi:hypothetical protein
VNVVLRNGELQPRWTEFYLNESVWCLPISDQAPTQGADREIRFVRTRAGPEKFALKINQGLGHRVHGALTQRKQEATRCWPEILLPSVKTFADEDPDSDFYRR